MVLQTEDKLGKDEIPASPMVGGEVTGRPLKFRV
jgi:hypothetical protein